MSRRLEQSRRNRRGGYIEPFFAGRTPPAPPGRLPRTLANALTSPLALVALPLVVAAVIALLS